LPFRGFIAALPFLPRKVLILFKKFSAVFVLCPVKTPLKKNNARFSKKSPQKLPAAKFFFSKMLH
jgi:hypothetical protein